MCGYNRNYILLCYKLYNTWLCLVLYYSLFYIIFRVVHGLIYQRHFYFCWGLLCVFFFFGLMTSLAMLDMSHAAYTQFTYTALSAVNLDPRNSAIVVVFFCAVAICHAILSHIYCWILWENLFGFYCSGSTIQHIFLCERNCQRSMSKVVTWVRANYEFLKVSFWLSAGRKFN